MKNGILDDYDERLLRYITEYTRDIGVPPTLDQMISNVEGISSKSTLYYRLQNMVRGKLLVQKNVKGYYYPTSIDLAEVSIPKYLLSMACTELIKQPENASLVKSISNYIS